MNSILVTGSSGFIGTKLVSSLMKKKYRLIGLSNKPDKNLVKNFIKKDIRKLDWKIIKGDFSSIIHLAAISDVELCQRNPILCLETNVLGTQKMLEIARKKDSKFIFISSGHVYAKPQKLPILEDHQTNPASMYAVSKLGGEICCKAYAESYGLEVTILRLFSVYGPNSSTNLVIPKIISQMMKHNIVKLGNLYPKRDFVFIDDVVSAIELAIKKSRGFNLYNVGTGQSYSILEVCNMIKKITGKNVKVKSVKSLCRKNEVVEIVSDSSKIKKLGWKPKVSLFNGLQKTIQAYEK